MIRRPPKSTLLTHTFPPRRSSDLFVFVTAYSDYALKAFDTHAIDYLMKPVEEDRLAATLDRVRLRLSEKRATEEANRLKEVLAEVAPEAELPMSAEAHSSNRYEKLINIKDRGQIFRVDVDSIEIGRAHV